MMCAVSVVRKKGEAYTTAGLSSELAIDFAIASACARPSVGSIGPVEYQKQRRCEQNARRYGPSSGGLASLTYYHTVPCFLATGTW
jgi:hypothetical protein